MSWGVRVRKVIGPQPGPQARFCASPADICIFGGEVAGGKSWILTYEPAAAWGDVPGFGGILFRRDSTQLVGPGSLWELARDLYPKMGAKLIESPNHVATFPSGAQLLFRHLQHEWTVEDHDGKGYAFVGFDEGQNYSEYMIWYMWARCRSSCGVKPYMRITCNPDPDCYLRTLLAWWIDPETGWPIPERDGVIRWALRLGEKLEWFSTEEEALAFAGTLDFKGSEKIKPISIQFIRSSMDDNPALLAVDPDYGARVAMLDEETRLRKSGNWNHGSQSGQLFDRSWFGILDREPDASQCDYCVRGWDKAATKPNKQNPDPDWTRGVKVLRIKNGDLVIADVCSLRDAPGEVDKLLRSTAAMDGPLAEQAFWRDPGQAGVVDEAHTLGLGLQGKVTFIQASKDKVAYAKPFSAFADSRQLRRSRVYLVRAPWNAAYLAELEKFPKPRLEKDRRGLHDDQVDATSRAYLAIENLRSTDARRWLKGMGKMV